MKNFIFIYRLCACFCVRATVLVCEASWRKRVRLSVNVGADLLSSLGLSNDEAVAWAVSR